MKDAAAAAHQENDADVADDTFSLHPTQPM